jgi:Mrp family chromosome partitioning ATPase
LESSLADLMIEYEGAKVTYGAQHEQVQQLESRIAAAKEELAEAVDTHISEEVEAPNPLHQELYRSLAEAEASVLAEGARERALETVAQDLRSRLAMLPIHERELGSIERDFRLLNEVYVELFKSYNETKLMEIMADTDLRVQYPAIPPKQPVSRGLLSKGVIGLVLGFLLGAFIAGLLEVTDRRVKSDEDLVEPLSIPVIARLPWYKDRPAPDEVPSRAAYAEAVRRWRMELLAGGGANDRTVILVGATATEGRSVALATLARQLAHGGVKVVAVDAAAEDPRLHQLMGVEATKGWWDAIAGAGSAVDMCQSTDVPNLHILPAGSEPVDPDGLMATGSADAALHQLREGFDVVLVDASPMSHNGSALLLAQLCDTVFLASRQGHSVRADVVDLAEMLREKGTPARGLVFFGVRKRG